LKRAFLQKVKPVVCCAHEVDGTVEQPKQATSGVKRRARTSAAMIGLALSMGASSLLLPRQDDGAVAAEPQPTDTVTAVPPDAQTTDAPVAVVAEPGSAHVVQQGQTLWQLARRYQVDAEAIAAANGLSTDTVLRVGQTLEIPAESQANEWRAASVESAPGTFSTPLAASDSSVLQSPSETALLTAGADGSLKAQQDEALERMRQKREELKASLTELQPAPALDLATELETELEKVREEVPARQDAKVPTPPLSRSPEPELTLDRLAETSLRPQLPSLPAAVPAPAASVPETVTHQVKPGETLGAIARTYNVSSQALVAANRLSDPDWLRVNQSLVIPQDEVSVVASSGDVPNAATVTEPPVESTASESVVYRVNPGDTIISIAHRYDIPQTAIVNANRLDNPNLIVVNQELTIPAIEATTFSEQPLVSAIPAQAAADSPDAARQTTAVVPDDLLAETPVEITPNVATLDEPQYYTGVTVPTVPPVSGSEIAAVPPAEPIDRPTVQPASVVSPVAVPAGAVSDSNSTVVASVGANSSSRPYVDNLMAEILSLRDRYQQDAARTSQPDTSQPAVVAATAPQTVRPEPAEADTAINPEFRPDAPAVEIQAEVQLPRQRQSEQAGAVVPEVPDEQSTTPPARTEQRVAVAPLGSESYEPLIQPITGRTVSPDLPPLAEAEAYLPESTPAFNGYRWPTRGVITSGYGWRWGRMHRGIDIGAPTGTPVVAAAAGEVVFAGWNSGGYGNMVDIRHSDGSVTRYAHNSRLLVRAGQQVEQGELISEVGSTGYSTGPHLHFEVRLPNQGTVNPIAYLPQSRD
jgi:murein DD-endopeptidase MepM/ murein hydrolase activator NlpD